MPEAEVVVDRVDALPSEDNGNVPVGDIKPAAPSAEKPAETPAEPKVEPATPAEPEVTLYELPDGRKVDAETLSKEWKEKFMPDYTKKSQALAAKGDLPTKEATPKVYESPEWAPKTYAELIDIAKAEVKGDLEAEQRAREEHTKQVEDSVIAALAELKASDPTLNENALFLHANKYGFRDLKMAHANMKEIADVMKKVQKTTADNITKRKDPVSISPGATGTAPNPSNFGTAVEYLRSIK